MKIAIVSKPNNGCCFYRCVLPISKMSLDNTYKLFIPDNYKKTGYTDSVGYVSEIELFEPDIIFFNKDIPGKNIDWFIEQKKKGIKIVLDIDDYWELSPAHPIYTSWYKTKSNIQVQENIKIADIVFCTTEILRKKIIELNKNCVVIPNAVPFGDPFYTQTLPKKDLSERKTNFLYAGGSTHYNDLLLLKNHFEKLGNEKYIKEKALFTLAGFNPVPNYHCEWDKMASIFKRTNSYQILNTLPIQQHMTFYDQADCCLVPLAKNKFNIYKSELKIIEAATRELPCIVSNTLPYSEFKDFPGIFFDDWQKNIKYILKYQKEVVSLGKELSERIKEKYDLKIWAKQREDIFTHIIK